MPEIEGFIFDVGGVLFKTDRFWRDVFPEIGRRVKELPSQLIQRYRQKETNFETIPSNGCNFSRLAAVLDLNISSQYLEEMINKFLGKEKLFRYLDANVIALVGEVRQRGYQAFCLSNVANFFDNYLKNNINPLFDQSFYSYEIGLRKPCPEIYEAVLKEVEISPQRLVFIDDRQKNLDYPYRIGINCLLYTNPTQLKTDLNKFL